MYKFTKAFSLLILCLITHDSVAQPSVQTISGNIMHGVNVTISGRGFGSKPQAAPRLWDTVGNQSAYENLTEGQTIPTGGSNPYTINTYLNRDAVKFTRNGNRHPRVAANYWASRAGYLHWPRVTGGEGGAPSSQNEIYVSFWIKPTGNIPSTGHSSKFVRVWDNPGGNGTRVSWTQMHLTYGGVESPDWGSWRGTSGQWNRLEFYIDGNANIIRAWTNGQLRHDIRDFVKNTGYQNVGLNLARVGFDPGGANPPSISFNFGEIYLDVTQARVEIGNAPTWQGVTQKEIQIPVSWSDISITFELNQGAMSNFDGKYVYVVDANGAVNNIGYPVCSDCPTPEPPSDLVAQ